MQKSNNRWAPHPEFTYDWQVLVTVGHVWVARINTLLRRAPWVATCLLLALASHDIISSTVILADRLTSYKSDAGAPNWAEKIFYAPLSSIQGSLIDSPEKLAAESPAPNLNKQVIQQVGNQALAPFIQLNQADRVALSAAVEKMKQPNGQNQQSIQQLVGMELTSLRQGNKLASVPLLPMEHLNGQWYKSIDQSASPIYKIGKDGAIWLGSVIIDTDGRIKPQLGIFHRVGGQYQYFNARPTEQFVSLPGYPVVSVFDIPRQVGNDFPELVVGATNTGDRK